MSRHICKFYPSPMIAAPSALVIDVPTSRRGRGLALERYYPIIVETDDERRELEAFLASGDARSMRPDLLDSRPSAMVSDRILISRYEPPAAGWPWLSVIYWPTVFQRSASEHGVTLARGAYTTELFENPDALEAHSAALLDALIADYSIEVRLLSGDSVSQRGSA